MFASSSKHALTACTRSCVTQRTGKAVSSTWQILSISQGKRRASTEAANSIPSVLRPVSHALQSGKNEDLFKIKRGAHITEYNMAMRDMISRRRSWDVVELAGKMKRAGIRPETSTYNNIINALALEYFGSDAWAVFHDMIAAGVEPDANTFNHLLYAHSDQTSDKILRILDEMKRHGVEPNARTYDFIIKYYLDCDDLEMALIKLAEMNDAEYSPSLKVAQQLIDSAGEAGQVRLALDLAVAYEETTVRRLDVEAWVKLLVYSAEQLYAEGVLRCWEKVVTELRILPDEGLCQLVLHTAARHGLPVLASDAIKQLESIGVGFQEHHFSSLLDAFVKNQQLKEAFLILDLMRTAKATPTMDTAYSIFQSIRYDPESIDNAYTILEGIHKEGQKVDVIAANVLIKASGALNDLQRAVGIYKALPSLDVHPDAETFELLLEACRPAGHLELGERLFAEMREAGIKPTANAFERLISLILTQTDYENAFFYLEEMKGAGYTPSLPIYEDIVRKCISESDSRYKLAIEELKQMGYSISPRLRRIMESGGQERRQ